MLEKKCQSLKYIVKQTCIYRYLIDWVNVFIQQIFVVLSIILCNTMDSENNRTEWNIFNRYSYA